MISDLYVLLFNGNVNAAVKYRLNLKLWNRA